MTTTRDNNLAKRPIPRPDKGVWPGLATPPCLPTRARIAESLFRRVVHPLEVQIVLPGGERLGAGGPGAPVMRIERPAAFFHRLGVGSKIGFGEAYMAGDWTSNQLADLLIPFAARLSILVPRILQRAFRRYTVQRQPREERNTIEGSRRNIQRHYDLTNDLFAAFLDKTMSYSSACFRAGSDDLADGQRHKIDSVLDMAEVGPGMHVLEIGTGWGELAIKAARRGARVTTLTISPTQARLAEERITNAGVDDRVQVLLRDYREVRGSYDAVVSVEMIEAVGDRYWPTYFAQLDELLRPGGRVGLQSITMPHDRMMASRGDYSWIHKYIFPGGMIPSVQAIEDNLRRHSQLRVAARRSFGQDYARTLEHWRRRFLSRWDDIAALGFDDTFRRMWEFYLAYCEAGFRVGYLDVYQFSLQRSCP
ncbi:MAG: class I SAM-dependent methyltransferase [Pseudonocardia sp.]|nr:class I SAM-dependent methyltransferase [Pseudonocardia sp.]